MVTFNNTPNKKIIDSEGNPHWKSRPVAVVAPILWLTKQNQVYVPLAKRSPKMESFVGYWGLPCGFIDWDETAAQAIRREIYEEIGLLFPENDIPDQPTSVCTDPNDDEKQVISLRYLLSSYSEKLPELRPSDEALEPTWFHVNELPKKMAFNHAKLLEWAIVMYFDFS